MQAGHAVQVLMGEDFVAHDLGPVTDYRRTKSRYL